MVPAGEDGSGNPDAGIARGVPLICLRGADPPPTAAATDEEEDEDDDAADDDEDDDSADDDDVAGAVGAAPPNRDASALPALSIQGCERASVAESLWAASTHSRPLKRVCRSALKESHATPGPKSTRPARLTRTVWPVRIETMQTPSDHTSALKGSYGDGSGRDASGATNGPSNRVVRAIWPWVAKPKSPIFATNCSGHKRGSTSRDPSRKMFSSLMSRCETPRECKWASPDAIPLAQYAVCASDSSLLDSTARTTRPCKSLCGKNFCDEKHTTNSLGIETGTETAWAKQLE
jgi:hypothetical protein